MEKMYIFADNVDVDESNCIVDIDKLTGLDWPKKISDENMVKLTESVLTKYRCYDVLDFNRRSRLDVNVAYKLYEQHKLYKGTSSKSNSTTKVNSTTTDKIGQLVHNPELDTSDTIFVGSLGYITTEHLVYSFGELIRTGGKYDSYRYEYKFEYEKNVFSIYDWVDESSSFYPEKDIYWHVASNTQDKAVIKRFVKNLKHQVTLYSEGKECC